MTNSDDVQKVILRNKLLGRWAAAKLGIIGRDADAYSDALAWGTVDPELCDVFTKIRKDFDAAGVSESDERILQMMSELMLKAGELMPSTRGDSSDAATVMIARNLMSK